MKQVIAVVTVNELPGQEIDLDDVVADITLYPNKEVAFNYSERIGTFYNVKISPIPTRDFDEIIYNFGHNQSGIDDYLSYVEGWNDCLNEITGETE